VEDHRNDKLSNQSFVVVFTRIRIHTGHTHTHTHDGETTVIPEAIRKTGGNRLDEVSVVISCYREPFMDWQQWYGQCVFTRIDDAVVWYSTHLLCLRSSQFVYVSRSFWRFFVSSAAPGGYTSSIFSDAVARPSTSTDRPTRIPEHDCRSPSTRSETGRCALKRASVMSFVQVSETNDAGDKEVVDLPLEKDGTLLLSTLHAQYPDACGLKYVAPDNGRTRALRLADDKLHPPSDDGWGDIVYFCSFNKGKLFVFPRVYMCIYIYIIDY